MLGTSCILAFVIQTKCLTMIANYPDYFDHVATLPGSSNMTMKEFLPNLTPWVTLFPTETPKPNTTKRTRTTKTLATKFFFVANSNISDIFTVTKTKSTVSTTITPYLTGFVTSPSRKVNSPKFVVLSTLYVPATDIIIPSIIEGIYDLSKLNTISKQYAVPTKVVHYTLPKKGPRITLPTKLPPITLPTKVPPITLPKKSLRITLPIKVPPITLPIKVPPITLPIKVPSITLPIKVPPITLPIKVPPITLPTKVPPITLPIKVPPITLPIKVPPITLPTKVPPITLPIKVPPITLPIKVPPITLPTKLPPITLSTKVPPITLPIKVPPITLPTKVPPITLPTKVPPITLPIKVPPSTVPKKADRSGLNNSTPTTVKQLLRVSPTIPTKTSQTETRKAANATNNTNPSVKVPTTVKLKANTSTSPISSGLTTVKPTSNSPKPELNKVRTVKTTTTNPGLNKTPKKNETGVPTFSQNAKNVQISTTASTTLAVVERAPKQEGPRTTVQYEDVIEYEEITTEPFSKFLERLLFQMAKMNNTYATRFIRNFDRIATSKVNAGAFHNFGPVTIKYIEEMLPGLETSTDILQRMFTLAFTDLKSRRKSLAVQTNELLDYMDMMFEPAEEKLMQEILNHIIKYPKTSKSAADICTDIINNLIIMPSKRLSGTKKGNILFSSLDNIILSKHPEYDHHRRNIKKKEAIAAITNQVGKSNRRNFNRFDHSNGRQLKALNHVSKSNRRHDGSIKNTKGKKSKAMHHFKGNSRKWMHVNEGNRKQYDRLNKALRRQIEPTNHGTATNRRNDGRIHNVKSREIEDKRKYDSINHSKGRKSKAIGNFNKATRKKDVRVIINKNKGYKAINHFNKSIRKKNEMAGKRLHDRRFGKPNLRRSYNTFNGRYQTTGWIRNAREGVINKYVGESDSVFGTFSDSDEFVQSESDDEYDEIEMERQRQGNIVFDRIQKLKSKHLVEPVIKTQTVRRQGSKKIKWGLPSWKPNENEFAVLRPGHYPSQRRTDRDNILNNKNNFEMFREGRPSSELPSRNIIKNKNNNDIFRIGQQYDNVNFSAPMKSQLQNNVRPVQKSFVSRQLKMLQITKRFHNYKPKMEENGEPSPSLLNMMDETLINRTSNTFTTELYEITPPEIPNNKSDNQRNSYNEINKNIGREDAGNAHANQQVISDDFDNSPSIIDFSMKVKLKKPQDARDGGELVAYHNINKVNMRGREAQVTEETRTWDPYQMDKYFAKTKVTHRDIKKRVYVRKLVSDSSDKSDGSCTSQYEQDVDDEESEQDESDRYTFKGVNRKNTHSKHHHKYRVKRHKRRNHDKYKHKKHRDGRHGTHKKIRRKHGFRQNTKKRKHGRNKHSHHKNHRYYKNKRSKKTHQKKHAMAIDPIRNRASDTRPIPNKDVLKYEKEGSYASEENSSNGTEQTVGISAKENKKYKPIGKLMEFDRVSTLKSNNEVVTYKRPRKVSEAQPKDSLEVKDLENKAKVLNNEGKVDRRNPKRRGAYVTIGLLMDDMIYKFRENELKRDVYDAFRQNYRRNYRRGLGYELHAPVLPPLIIREDSIYTDEEAVLKRNIYKAINNPEPDMLDQNKPKVLIRTF